MSDEQDLESAEPTPSADEELAPEMEASAAVPTDEELSDEQLADISAGAGAQPPPMNVQPPTS